MLKNFIIASICLIGVSIASANQCIDLFGPSSLARALGLIRGSHVARKIYFKDWLASLEFYEKNNFVFPKDAYFSISLKVEGIKSAKDALDTIKMKFPFKTDPMEPQGIVFFIPVERVPEFLTLLSSKDHEIDRTDMPSIDGPHLRGKSNEVHLEASVDQAHSVHVSQELQINSLRGLTGAALVVPLRSGKSDKLIARIYHSELGWRDIIINKNLWIEHNYPKKYDELIARAISEGLYNTALQNCMQKGIEMVSDVSVSIQSIVIDTVTNLPVEINLAYSIAGSTKDKPFQRLEVNSTTNVHFIGTSITNPFSYRSHR